MTVTSVWYSFIILIIVAFMFLKQVQKDVRITNCHGINLTSLTHSHRRFTYGITINLSRWINMCRLSGTNQRSGLLVRHNHYDTIASGAAATPPFVVFRGKRSYRQPSPHGSPLSPRWCRVICASIKSTRAPPLQLRRMEYSVEVVWHERALC